MHSFLFLFLLFNGILFAQKANTQSFLALAKTALSNLPQTQISHYSTLSQQQQYHNSISEILPQISAEASSQYGLEAFQDSLEKEYKPSKVSFILSQKILDIRSFQNIAIQSKQIEANKASHQETLYQALFSFGQDWATLWRNQKRLKIIHEMITLTTQDLKNTKYRFHAGELTKVDVTKIASKHYSYLNQSSAIKKDSQISKHKLNSIYNIIAPSTLNLPQISLNVIATDSLAYQKSPKFLNSQIEVNIARSKKNQEYSDFFPVITTSATAFRSWHSGNPTLPKRYDDVSVGLNLKWDLFKSTGHYSSLSKAQFEFKKTRLKKEKLKRELQQQIAEAAATLISAQEQVQNTQHRVSAAKEGLEGTTSEFLAGTRTTTDLVAAQEEYLNARLEEIDIKMNFFLAQFSYLNITGELSLQHLEKKYLTL